MQLLCQAVESPISIYIHYPFCKSKCPYCDFNSHVRENVDYSDFLTAYLKELEYFAQSTNNRPIGSIFFGGGTPSLMPVFFVEKILEKIYSLWSLKIKNTGAKNIGKIEISLEANPNSSDTEKLSDLRKVGINRLSLGIQSLREKDLKFLGRNHSLKEAKQAIDIAQKHFDNFSFDLIYARQEQSVKSWGKELEEALKIGSPHLSLYQLTIEKGTKFFDLYRQKKFQLPNSEVQNALYDITFDICSKYGLDLYEISNYAKPEFYCHHNLNYWQYGDYIGIGAGAHGRISLLNHENGLFYKQHFINHHQPEKWLSRILKGGNAVQKKTILNRKEILEEILIMGLRTKFGISKENFQKFIGEDHIKIFGEKKLTDLATEKLIIYNQEKIIPTHKGLKLANSIYQYLITKNFDF